ncbi:MAG: hypothetical protein AB7U65_09080 [Halothiobacillaceae bacterium]
MLIAIALAQPGENPCFVCNQDVANLPGRVAPRHEFIKVAAERGNANFQDARMFLMARDDFCIHFVAPGTGASQ